MEAIVRTIDTFTVFLGRAVAWLSLTMVLTAVAAVVLRQFFTGSTIAVQESVQYMHATVFMIGIAYALRFDQHVRVDIFYSKLTPRSKAIINIVGTILFLIPFSIFIIYYSWSSVARAWHVMESTMNAGGLPYVYLLKTLIPIFAGLLALQGVAEIFRNILILRGKVITDGESA